jgi:lysophospholipase L1-like esterase
MKSARAIIISLLTFVALNGLLVLGVRRAGLLRRPFDIQSAQLYALTVDPYFASTLRAQRAVIVGDSVVFGGKLAETHGRGWEEETLPAHFERLVAPSHRVLNLGINGLLFSELECVTRDVLDRGVDLLVLNVSPRPFAADFDTAHPPSERPFLCGAPGGRPLKSKPIEDALPVLRYRDLLQTSLFGGPLRSALTERFDVALRPQPADDEDARELQEAIRRLRAAQRYNSISVSASHAQAASLFRLLGALVAATPVPVVVFYLEENVADVSDQLDRPRYQTEQRAFVELLQRRLAGVAHVRLAIVSGEDVGNAYSDQVHLTSAGYRRLAERLHAEALAARGGNDR